MPNSSDVTHSSVTDADIPQPSKGARWRWSVGRRAVVGGGILAVSLGLAGAAGAATGSGPAPSSSTSHQAQPPSQRQPPTAAGKVTALGTDTITITTRESTSQTITYSSSTTFRSPSGSTTSSALAVGDFVGVTGTKNTDGSVSATSIMVATKPPGQMGRPQGANRGGTPAPGAGVPTAAS